MDNWSMDRVHQKWATPPCRPPIFTTPKNTVTLELTRTWITLYSQSQIVFNIANFGISELLTTEHLSESL